MTSQHDTASDLQLDLEAARAYLAALDPAGTFTFQTFPDNKAEEGKRGPAKVLHGTFDEHWQELVRLNEAGAGIFVMVNAGDGIVHPGQHTVRTADNVIRVRAVFVDLDGAPLEPVTSCEAPPHIIVGSSPGKWHAYWLVSDCALEEFSALQVALEERFDGDHVIDLPRVLRVPGFLHQKEDPFIVRLIEPQTFGAVAPVSYNVAELSRRLGLTQSSTAPEDSPRSTSPGESGDILRRSFSDGERTQHLVQLAGKYFAKGRTLDEVIAIARGWNSQNTPPLDADKVVSTCEGIQKTHLRNHPDAANSAEGGKVTPLFPLADARIDRFIGEAPPARRWLLKDCLPQGKVGALIAPGGTGKSQFLLQLATSVATGENFLGWEIGEAGGVLCLFAEDDEEEIHRRLFNIAVQFGRRPDLDNGFIPQLKANLHIKSMVGLDNLMTIADRHSGEVTATTYADRLLLVAREIPDLKLIVIDPGSRFRGGDENFAQDTTRFIEVLEQISRGTGANVLVAHHANKGSMSGGEQNQGAQRGSSAFTDGVRWQMNLSYLNESALQKFQIRADEKRLYLTATVVKNNYGPPGIDLVLRRDEEGLLAPADLSAQIADVDALVLQKVKTRIRLELGAGKTYTRAKFEAQFGGAVGDLKIGKNRLRLLLKKWVGAKELHVSPKKHLYPDASMASRYPALSDKSTSKSTH